MADLFGQLVLHNDSLVKREDLHGENIYLDLGDDCLEQIKNKTKKVCTEAHKSGL